MSSMADRLRRARIARGFDEAYAAAEAFDWNRNTYSSNENGNAPFSRKAAAKYAAAFGVNLDWLYDGRGAMRGSSTGRPILGKVGAGGEALFEDDHELGAAHDYLEPLRDEGLITLVIDGESMLPRFKPGERATFGPRFDDPSILIGQEVMARLADGRKLVKVLRPGTEPGRFTLYSVNTTYAPEENVELLWALPFRELRP